MNDIIAMLRSADELHARAVAALSSMKRCGSFESATGLPAEMAIRLMARRARWDARDLAAAADSLSAMPLTAAALERGDLSWSQARAIVRAARDVKAEDRTAIDRLVGTRAHDLTEAEPERIVDEVEDEVARLRSDLALRREDRAIGSSFLSLRPRLGGGGSLYGEADTESFATIAEALDAAAARPVRADDPGDSTSRGTQRMDALVAICGSHLAGDGNGPHARPRPRLIATMDLNAMLDAGLSEAARVLWAVAGRPARLTPLATEVLACDAEIVPVIFDGARPVAVGDASSAIPSKVRTAVIARDRGCRFPGCGAAASWTDVHHIVARLDGGTSDIANLVLLCRRCHRRVHRGRWRIAPDENGAIRFDRGRLRFSSPPFHRPPPRE